MLNSFLLKNFKYLINLIQIINNEFVVNYTFFSTAFIDYEIILHSI